MLRPLTLLFIASMLTACTSSTRAPQSPPVGEPFLRIARSHTSSGGGPAWTISDGHLRISLSRGSIASEEVVWERPLSRSEIDRVFESLDRSGLRHRSPRDIWGPRRDDGIILSDFMVTSFRFLKGTGEESRASAVTYWTEIDDAAKSVIDAVEALLPAGYRIIPPTTLPPNKAPEPTP